MTNTSRRVLLATRSRGKLVELQPLFAAAGFDPVDLVQAGLPEEPVEADIECHETFEANALAKARYFNRKSGLPTIADDSGLEVRALSGAPGVHSKRWSARVDLMGQALDDANNEKLLSSLLGVANRGARYVCVGGYVDGEHEVVARGETEGEILREARGAGGFGYDPYFFSYDLGAGFGESTRAEKEEVSHRGRAMRALVSKLSRGR